MRRLLYIPTFLILLLSGCAQTAATVTAEGAYLLQASIDYIHRVHDKRRVIEAECWQSVQREINKLRALGDEDAVRALLIEVYPQPVSLALLKKARDDPASILSKPPGCPDPDEEPSEDPGERPGIFKEDETEFLS